MYLLKPVVVIVSDDPLNTSCWCKLTELASSTPDNSLKVNEIVKQKDKGDYCKQTDAPNKGISRKMKIKSLFATTFMFGLWLDTLWERAAGNKVIYI